jgi:hypothetical protein
MFRKLWELATTLLILARDLQQYRQEQKEIRQELRDLTIAVHALAQDNKNFKDNVLLEIENKLLKYEKALPPARASKKSAKKGSKK